MKAPAVGRSAGISAELEPLAVHVAEEVVLGADARVSVVVRHGLLPLVVMALQRQYLRVTNVV